MDATQRTITELPNPGDQRGARALIHLRASRKGKPTPPTPDLVDQVAELLTPDAIAPAVPVVLVGPMVEPQS